MSPQEFSDWLYYHSFTGAMSQEYYRFVSSGLWCADMIAKIATLVLAILAVAMEIRAHGGSPAQPAVPKTQRQLDLAGKTNGQKAWAIAVLILGFLPRLLGRIIRLNPDWPVGLRFTCWSAFFAGVVVLVPFADWNAECRDLAKEWGDFRAEVDALDMEFREDKEHKKDHEFAEHRKKIMAEMSRIEGEEFSFQVPWLADWCQTREENRRGATPESRQIILDRRQLSMSDKSSDKH